MFSKELRKQFIIFFVAAGTISLVLILLPFAEPGIRASIAGFFGTTDSHIGETAVELFNTFLKIFKIVIWMALVISIVRFVNFLIFGTALKNSGNVELATLLRNVASIIIYLVAFFTIYKSQYPNHDLTTLFAGSTIIGVVLGLALQDTLGNLFAGLAMQADQPFQIGDVINITNKGMGVVESISWRGIKIRTFQNKLVIISNANLGKEAIEVAPRDNLNARLVLFNTLYTNSPARTIQTIREAVRQVENVSPKMRPIVRIRDLSDNGIGWEIKYWLEDYTKFNDTDALIRQRVWYAFQREGIEFAYPTRTIYIENKPPDPTFEETGSAIFDRLSSVPLFAPLSDEETERLARACLVRVFAPGEAIVRQNQHGGSMFVIHRGAVGVQIIENGAPKIINNLSEGEFFGEMGLFTGEPRTATVIAREETEVLEIRQYALKPLLEENPALVEALSKTIAERRLLLAQSSRHPEYVSHTESSGVINSIRKFFGLR